MVPLPHPAPVLDPTAAVAPPWRTGVAWLAPAGLMLLTLLPILGRALSAAAAAAHPELAAEGAGASPSPLVVVHVLAGAGYGILGALQLSDEFRRRRPGRHRVAGRVVVLAGLLAALSGLALTLLPRPGLGVDLLLVLRLTFGSAMAVALVLGVTAIRRRDATRHRAWMIRAYAIGLGAGTQVLTQGFGGEILGRSALSLALLAGAAWLINLAVAELVIRRPGAPRRAAAGTTA